MIHKISLQYFISVIILKVLAFQILLSQKNYICVNCCPHNLFD